MRGTLNSCVTSDKLPNLSEVPHLRVQVMRTVQIPHVTMKMEQVNMGIFAPTQPLTFWAQ